MRLTEPSWSIPLDMRPTVVNMGIAVHGRTPIERYRLQDLWCVHLYGYTADLSIDGIPCTIRPGYASVIPPDRAMEYHFAGRSVHAYAHFTLPGDQLWDNQQDAPVVPAVQDLADRFGTLSNAFEQAVSYVALQPRRAEVRLWDLLWELTDHAQRSIPPVVHPAVQRALHIIEVRLSDPITIPTLAHEVGLSHNHLTRLFRATYGVTVSAYIRQRRMERAQHLLLHSTLPIKAIAAQVGIADLHLFNKTIHRVLHDSPRRVRDRFACVTASISEPSSAGSG